MHKDDLNQKNLDNQERQKKKSSSPQDNTGSGYVDPVSDARTHHEAGKGDKIRDISGWYSDDVTKRLEEIFGKKDVPDGEEKEKKAK